MKTDVAIIVESKNKSVSLSEYLKKDPNRNYVCLYSAGHIYEARPGRDSITLYDDGRNIRADVNLMPKNKYLLDGIMDACSKTKHIYIATDPDREGEGIAKDLSNMLSPLNIPMTRMRIWEYSQKAIYEALEQEHEFNNALARSAQVRGIIDRYIGVTLSSYLKMGSVGRVQSPLLKLSNEYPGKRMLRLKSASGSTIEGEIRSGTMPKNFTGVIVHKTPNLIRPPTTYDLQKRGWDTAKLLPSRTMEAAQELYNNGILSYPRTDSTRLSDVYIDDYLARYRKSSLEIPVIGEEYARSKVSGVRIQDAHEALHIIGYSSNVTDENMKTVVEIIKHQTFESLIYPSTVLVRCSIGIGNDFVMEMNIKQADMLTVGNYVEGELFENRLSPSSMVEIMHNVGIGRPSTTAGVIDNLLEKKYVMLQDDIVSVTELGKSVIEEGLSFCPFVFESDLTSRMEMHLDAIAAGGTPKELFKEVYELVTEAQESRPLDYKNHQWEPVEIPQNTTILLEY